MGIKFLFYFNYEKNLGNIIKYSKSFKNIFKLEEKENLNIKKFMPISFSNIHDFCMTS